MATDEQIIDHHRRQRDRLKKERVVIHRFSFSAMTKAEGFATAARQAGFLVGASESAASKVEVCVDRIQPLVGDQGAPHENFATITTLAARYEGERLNWRAPIVKSGGGNSIAALVKGLFTRRRLKRL